MFNVLLESPLIIETSFSCGYTPHPIVELCEFCFVDIRNKVKVSPFKVAYRSLLVTLSNIRLEFKIP